MEDLAWNAGSWLNPPPHCSETDAGLSVECSAGSDFWRNTYYGFDRTSGHALLFEFERGQAIEIDFVCQLSHQYDQAGLLVWEHERNWVKSGVELSDAVPQLGAVVTRELSDWSCAPVPMWHNSVVTMRASWLEDSLVIRSRSNGGAWRMVRLAPWQATAPTMAGLYCAAPERPGFSVQFARLATGDADQSLHLGGS